MELIKTCPFCGRTTTLTNVNAESYFAWMNGELIQNAFPMSTPMEREVIKTGMCAKCQHEMFDLGDPEEEDEDWDDEYDDCDYDEGFDPYLGCWTGDC